MNTIAKYFLNFELLQKETMESSSLGASSVKWKEMDISTKEFQITDVNTRKEAEKRIDALLNSDLKGKESIVISDLLNTFKEGGTFSDQEVNIYKYWVRDEFLKNTAGLNTLATLLGTSYNKNATTMVRTRLNQLGYHGADGKTISTSGSVDRNFLFAVAEFQLTCSLYESGAKQEYNGSSKIDCIPGKVTLEALLNENNTCPTKWSLSLNEMIEIGEDLKNHYKKVASAVLPNTGTKNPEKKDSSIPSKSIDKNNPTPATEPTEKVVGKETTPLMKTPKNIKEVEERFELGDTGLSIAKSTDGTSSISFEGNKVTVWFTKNKKSNVITFEEGEVSASEGKIFNLNGEKFRFVPSIEKQKVIISKIDSSTSSQPQETQTINKIEDEVATIPNKVETEESTVVSTPAPETVRNQAPVETDLGDGDKTKKEIRREKKLDKSQEKSTETLTNESYSGKRIQKASEEIIVQAIQETLEGNNNVGDATGLSKVLTTIQNEHEKKAKSLDAVSREDQDKLITNKEKKVKSNEDKLMDVNDSATAKILNNTKDEISGLNKKWTELEAIRVSTDAKETERTNALNKANSEEKASDKINWFNKANILRGEVKTEKMREVKNIQDKTTKVSDYYKGHLDAVDKSAFIFQNRVKRYEKAVNSITTSLNSYAQQFQKNVKQKKLTTSISEDASGNVVYPTGFDNFLNLPTTIGASATKQLYSKVLENSNKELRTEIDYLYLKLTGITNTENTDVTKLDLTEKKGEDNYNTILAQSQKSLGVIEVEKSNLQNIYKTGPDGYIMIKGNQEADMKEYEILYSEFSTLTQEYLKGEREYKDKENDSNAQAKLLWDSSTGRRMQYKTWINEVAGRMNDLVGNKAGSSDAATAVLTINANHTDASSINYLYPSSEATSLTTLTTGKIGAANTLLKAFDGQENNTLPYKLTNPVKKSVLELGEDISNNTNIDYKMVAKDYKSYIEDRGRQ